MALMSSAGGLVPPTGDCTALPCPDPSPPLPCPLAEAFSSIFAAADADQDKVLTWEEFHDLTSLLMGPLNYEPAFRAADGDGDDIVTQAELEAFLAACRGEEEGEVAFSICEFLLFYGPDLFLYDVDNDGLVSWAELPTIAFFTTPYPDLEAMFYEVDTTNDGKLSREEVAALEARCNGSSCPPGAVCPEGEGTVEGEWPWEGEWPGEGELPWEGEWSWEGEWPMDPCIFLWYYGDHVLIFDRDGDGQVRLEELPPIPLANGGAWVVDPVAMFHAVDADGDGFLTEEEVGALAARCGYEGEREGCAEASDCEGEPNGCPPGMICVEGEDAGEGAPELHVCDFVLMYGAQIAPYDQDQDGRIRLEDLGPILFEEPAPMWIGLGFDPAALFALVDADQNEFVTQEELDAVVSGCGFAGDGEGGGCPNGAVCEGEAGGFEGAEESSEGEAWPPGVVCHSADYNSDWRISLSELLRCIQLFNSDGYHCTGDSEDGYGLNDGPRACAPHSSDYAPQDWHIHLSELLRLVQLFNTESGNYAAQIGSEDGYAPGNFRAP
jgi:Ca2+-binding EF-hand superfamily protein